VVKRVEQVHIDCLSCKEEILPGDAHFIYTATFSTSGLDGGDRCEELLQLLSVADTYAVASMIRAVTEVWKGMLGDLELSDLQRAAFKLPEIYSQYEDVRNLEDEARESLFQRFNNVATWNEPAFRSLAFESVSYLVTRDELEAQSEEDIFEQTLGWVKETYEDAEVRQTAMGELCSHLRFALMSGDFVTQSHEGSRNGHPPCATADDRRPCLCRIVPKEKGLSAGQPLPEAPRR
jgi:hypothetical protein